MTPDRRSESTTNSSSSSSESTSNLAQASQRWTAMATNLLATGVVLIGGLTFGRYVVKSLWTEERPPVDHATEVVGRSFVGNENVLHLLQFGDTDASLFCRTVSGGYESVMKAQRERTAALTRATIPDNSAATQAESDWLKRTEKLKPVAADGDNWQVFQVDGPVPISVGIRPIAPNSQTQSDQQVAGAARRVVCWSVAFPSQAESTKTDSTTDRWALFMFVLWRRSRRQHPGRDVTAIPETSTPAPNRPDHVTSRRRWRIDRRLQSSQSTRRAETIF